MAGSSPTLSFPRSPRRGMALVLVLSCLTLLSILVIAFLSSISTEVESSSSYASSNDVKQRSQTAVNMVIAQIQDATSSSTIAWSSQPGLIRTFDSSGNPDKAFKLYSSSAMVADSTFNPDVANTEVPNNWKTRPSEYTDLNQPVLVADPSGTFTKDGIKYTPNYPILDPGALGTVKGFSINGSVVPPNYSSINPLTDNPAPMPVQWLYMLKDGSLRAIDGTGKIPDATKTNPIVSRIAFWTDDDTCKVNINTAAGDEWNDTTNPGSFADMPMAQHSFEGLLKSRQPVMHEYQRYPGHPATTYLSAVFPNLSRAQIAVIAPRVSGGGSAGGTTTTFSGSTGSVAALPLSDGMPLYASVDELRYLRSTTARSNQDSLFTPQQIEESKFFLTAHSRAPEVNLFNQPRISLWPEPADPAKRTAFDRAIAFCSTVGGKAFYFVRNSSDSPTKDYADYSRNQELYSYLQTLTGQNIPGFGGTFLAKYPSPGGTNPTERDQILTEIFDYIRSSINLIDTTTGATPYAGAKASGNSRFNPAGTAQVVPIQIGNTRGFGNIQTIYTVNLRFDGLDTGVYNVTSGARVATATGTSGYKMVTTKIQALLLVNSFIVGQGVMRNIPNLVYQIEGLDKLTVGESVTGWSAPLGFPSSGAVEFNRMTNNNDYAMGGFSGAGCLFFKPDGSTKTLGASTLTSSGVSDSGKYPFFSGIVDLPACTIVPGVNGAEFKQPLTLKSTGPITLKIFVKDKSGSVDTAKPIQTFELNFPDTTFPTPGYSNSMAKNGNIMTSGNKPSVSISPDGCMINGQVVFNTNDTMSTVSRGLVPMSANVRGDMRVVAARSTIASDVFVPASGYYGKAQPPTPASSWGYRYVWPGYIPFVPDHQTDGMMAGSDRSNAGGGWGGYPGSLVAGVTYNIHSGEYAQPQGGTAAFYPDPDQTRPNPMKLPNGSAMTNEALLLARDGSYKPGDWDNGVGGFVDGPYINKADEGETGSAAYSSYDSYQSIGTLFSPNRQVPSAGMLGSLSSGVVRGLPWQTLLFCPNPPAKELHPGWGTPQTGSAGPGAYPPYSTPPDHLLLDLFTMPVVEPYAISEPFSTSGKVNINYQIVPFTYINRSTGVRAVLGSELVARAPAAAAPGFDSGSPIPFYKFSGGNRCARLPLNLSDSNGTLRQFKEKFDQWQIFKSASEICDVYLTPSDPTDSTLYKWTSDTVAESSWYGSDFALVGDNTRERPYGNIYPRLTTKSNTFTVHYKVQSLKNPIGTAPNQWNESRGTITGELRGSTTLERYLNPNNSGLPDYATSSDSKSVDNYYRWRVVSNTVFSP